MSLRASRRPYDSVKRALDIAGSGAGLILLSPVIAIVAASVAVKLGRPILFTQERPGRDGEIFTLIKFRTMKNVDPSKGLVTNEERITPFGSRLRATSLDELPTLVNVLKGDMSIVGPRPLLVEYLDRYTPEQSRRHEVRPGVTGLAQVSGRNSISWSEKLRLDVIYVDSRSILLDCKVLWRTVMTVLRREGIASEGTPVGAAFTGDERSGGRR